MKATSFYLPGLVDPEKIKWFKNELIKQIAQTLVDLLELIRKETLCTVAWL